MRAIQPDTRLGDLVTARPDLAATLDQLGLDFCCGGRRSLAEAAHEAGLDVADLVETLEAEPVDDDGANWADMGPADLVDHLEGTHHAYLHTELPRLAALADKVATVHGERHPELADVRRLVHELRADLEPHLRKEEQVLFPMIRELMGGVVAPSFHCGSIGNPISVMLLEHDRAGELLADLRATTVEYRTPDDGCASYRALYDGLAQLESDTHLHVHKENNLLFPAVLRAERAWSSANA